MRQLRWSLAFGLAAAGCSGTEDPARSETFDVGTDGATDSSGSADANSSLDLDTCIVDGVETDVFAAPFEVASDSLESRLSLSCRDAELGRPTAVDLNRISATLQTLHEFDVRTIELGDATNDYVSGEFHLVLDPELCGAAPLHAEAVADCFMESGRFIEVDAIDCSIDVSVAGVTAPHVLAEALNPDLGVIDVIAETGEFNSSPVRWTTLVLFEHESLVTGEFPVGREWVHARYVVGDGEAYLVDLNCRDDGDDCNALDSGPAVSGIEPVGEPIATCSP